MSAASPDHQQVAGADVHGAIPVWDTKTGASSRVIAPAQDVEIREIAWNRTGAIAALDDNDTIRVIAADKAQPIVSIPINTRAGQHLAWANNDSVTAVPVGDRGVILVRPLPPDGKIVSLGDNQQGQAWGVAAIADGPRLFVSYVGGGIKIWDVTTNKTVGLMPPLPDEFASKIGVGSLSVSRDRRLLATSSGNGYVPVYDINKPAIWQVLKTETPEISSVAFSPDGQKLAALSADNWRYIWTIGPNAAELYLAVPVITRRTLIGAAGKEHEHATWLDWIADDRVAIATGIAALRVVTIDPEKWLKRTDGLALGRGVPTN
jgi:WD40 repeat protein